MFLFMGVFKNKKQFLYPFVIFLDLFGEALARYDLHHALRCFLLFSFQLYKGSAFLLVIRNSYRIMSCVNEWLVYRKYFLRHLKK